MSFRRKNSRRLRDLRYHGVPINGDYILTSVWGIAKQGEYIDVKTQKEWLVALGPVKRAKAVRLPGVGRRLQRGRAA